MYGAKLPRKLRIGELLTVEWLNQAGACWYQLKKFERLFPDGLTLRRKNLLLAAQHSFDLDWFASRMGMAPYRMGEKIRLLHVQIEHSWWAGQHTDYPHGPIEGIRKRRVRYYTAIAKYMWKRVRSLAA